MKALSLICVTTSQRRELVTLVRGFQKCVDHHQNSIVDCEGNDYTLTCSKDNDVNEENQGFYNVLNVAIYCLLKMLD